MEAGVKRRYHYRLPPATEKKLRAELTRKPPSLHSAPALREMSTEDMDGPPICRLFGQLVVVDPILPDDSKGFYLPLEWTQCVECGEEMPQAVRRDGEALPQSWRASPRDISWYCGCDDVGPRLAIEYTFS